MNVYLHALLFQQPMYVVSLQISENGLLVVTNDNIETDRKETYTYPSVLDESAFEGVKPEVGALIAPFWADTESDSTFRKVCR